MKETVITTGGKASVITGVTTVSPGVILDSYPVKYLRKDNGKNNRTKILGDNYKTQTV